MMKQVLAKVLYNKRVGDGIYEMKLTGGGAELEYFVPGQFAHLKIPGRPDLPLRRPLSVNSVDLSGDAVILIYQIVGAGTDALAKVKEGETMDVIMPIGAGFRMDEQYKNIFLVGGGIGIAPLRTIFEKWNDRDYTAFLGFRGKAYTYQLDVFNKACENVYISSDDGTVGRKGFITDALKEILKNNKPDVVYTCGPKPMLIALKGVLEGSGIPAFVSMEERMGCGIGGCSCCVCGVKQNGELAYKKVCIEGPVFPFSEVVI